MTISKVKLNKFTAFENLEINFSKGLNVFIGENGTGKTHLMKVMYSACDVTKTEENFAEKIVRVFLPKDRAIGRLVKREKKSNRGFVEVYRIHTRRSDRHLVISRKIRLSFTNHTTKVNKATIRQKLWNEVVIEAVYIPVKEMLSNAPGFRALYNRREIHFEEVYADIIDRAFLPIIRGPMDQHRKSLISKLSKILDGKVVQKNEEFFLKNRQGELEFTLLSEGMRKLGLLWILIQNGSLQHGSVLFWDEPEANLNPKLFGTVIEILLELQRSGVQIFLATHDYVILKEIDFRTKQTDDIKFHALYRNQEKEIEVHSVKNYLHISPNAIDDAFSSLYDREVFRALGGNRK